MNDYRVSITSKDLLIKSADVQISAVIKHVSFEGCVSWAKSILPLEGTYAVTVVHLGIVHKGTVTK